MREGGHIEFRVVNNVIVSGVGVSEDLPFDAKTVNQHAKTLELFGCQAETGGVAKGVGSRKAQWLTSESRSESPKRPWTSLDRFDAGTRFDHFVFTTPPGKSVRSVAH
jgi:hypothetical protein